MEKSKSFPYHSASYKEARFDFEDRTKSFSFNGPRRIASYNMYSVEGKVKTSLMNGFKWIKSKFYDNYYD
ncbi:unnamed protein product [Withania somnifera]